MKVRYSVSPEDVASHYVHVSIDVSELPASPGEIDMIAPVWVPGSYLVRDFARLFRGIKVAGAEGAALAATKVRKNRWRVAKGKETSFTFSYRVYAHDLSVEGLDLSDEHLYFNPGVFFLYPDGSKDLPMEIVVHAPSGWKVYTELQEVARDPPRFRASNFDELVDSPFDVGNPTELTIRPAGVPHRVLLCGRGLYSPHKVEEDLQKIIEATYRIFGELPMPRYTFFFHLTDGWDGGLEHLAGTAITTPSTVFRPKKDYEDFLDVSAHEYFHLFNVKRIRPKVLGPFDYENENYTRMLWAMEGTTDYYCHLLLRRAGVCTPKRYLEGLGDRIKKFKETPGRNHQSLEEASFDTWIDLYRRHEETRNISISYYMKGDLVSMCLDLEVRGRTGNQRSLDDVMRHLWTEFAKKGQGIPEGDWQREAEKATGVELASFFDKNVRGREELDLPLYLRHAGLLLEPKDDEAGEDEPVETPGYLGVEFKKEGDRSRVSFVLDGTPARRAGISVGDEIVALDRYRVTHDSLADMLKRFPPGQKAELTLFRRGQLRQVDVTLGKPPPSKWIVKPDPAATDAARKVLEGWLETPFDSLPGRGKDEKKPAA